MQSRPLAQQLAVRTRILELVTGGSRQMIRGDIPNDIAAGLNGVHLDLRQRPQYVRDVIELEPVVLDVLACREVSVAAVVTPGNVRELAHLA